MTSAGEGEMVNEFQFINALVSSWTCPTCNMHVEHVHELTKALMNWNSFAKLPSPADVM